MILKDGSGADSLVYYFLKRSQMSVKLNSRSMLHNAHLNIAICLSGLQPCAC
jgi:hypothetical protein